MKYNCSLSLMIIISVLLFFSSLYAQNSTNLDVFEINKRIGRGVNIIGYDPIWRNFEEGRFKEKHFYLIKEAGFNSVRINLHAYSHMDNSTLKLSDEWFHTLDWAIKNAIENDLMVIVDLHNFIEMGKDPVGLYSKFIAFWEQVSEHLKDAPDNVIFEILNEPNSELNADLWNEYFPEALKIIRRTNPNRAVIIGPPFWNSIFSLNDLKLPEDDPNIIITVHYYLPMEFTHQGAAWAPAFTNLSGIKWGTDKEKQKVVDDFSMVQKWAADNNLPIHLGEFGAYDQADIESRVNYINYIVRTAESFDWSWSYWQFDSDFIVYNIKEDKWNEPILKALIPERTN